MARNRWRVYVNPFDANGVYRGYQDVSNWVGADSLGSISQDLDSADFSLGVYRTSNLSITFRNDTGLFADVDNVNSIFRYKRGDSLVKVTWEMEDEGPFAGIAMAGESFLSEEMTMFIGLVNDDSLALDVDSQRITFTLVGREQLLQRMTVPFGSISAGQNISTVIYACLNQSPLKDLVAVSLANITPGTDVALDSISDLENKTVKTALDDLLLLSNSVLVIANDTVFVKPRTATAAVKYNFYGQSSPNGPENIQNIRAVKNGMSRVFNFLSWKLSSPAQNISVQNTSSVAKYGARTPKAFSQTIVTDSTKQQTLMNAILSEFALPKQEFDLYTPLTYGTLGLALLDRVVVDYPYTLIPGDFPIPICGTAICGTAVLPNAIFGFSIPTLDNYKIIGKSLDIKNAIYRLKMRKI